MRQRVVNVVHAIESRTRWKLLFVAVLALLIAGFLSVAAARHGYFDLGVYQGAMGYWVHDGGEIYDYLKPGTRYGFTYPPFAALSMLPLAYLGWHVAILGSVTGSVLATAVVVGWLVLPIARRQGWTRWFAMAVALCLAAAFEPIRETVNFGQVNMLLLVVVAFDVLWLVSRKTLAGSHSDKPHVTGSRFAGIGIGLATAVKLTPGVFILYLLVTRRWRAAAVATGTAAAATLAAAAIAPGASREFWTQALWDTSRVGSLGFISNQSLRGVIARSHWLSELGGGHGATLLWVLGVIAVLTVWAIRARAAVAAGDEVAGMALTGVAGCLISPVTWIHHLVWLFPALVLLVDHGVASPVGSRRRRALLAGAIFGDALLSSRFVWLWESGAHGLVGFLGSNAYVWASLALLVGTPIRRPAGAAAGVAPAAPVDAGAVGSAGAEGLSGARGSVEGAGQPVGVAAAAGPVGAAGGTG
jgi:alpha-1,2-mannosyltransferase